MKILSILIPSIPDRDEMLGSLLNNLIHQIQLINHNHPDLGDVEFIVDNAESYLNGGPSIGRKRNSLLNRAKGKYLCFLDDDESISPDYVETLVRLCHEDKDVVTFSNISKLGNYWMVVHMGLGNENEQARPGVIKRKPWHICPVRTSYAQKYSFSNSNYGEDWEWFEKVLSHCKTEANTVSIIHQYNHGKHSEADKIKKHEQLQSEPGTESNT